MVHGSTLPTIHKAGMPVGAVKVGVIVFSPLAWTTASL